MDVTLPTDCGNAPRIGIVGDVVSAWARDDQDTLNEWLREDAEWSAFGDPASRDAGGPSALNVRTIITHGRLASCDGELDFGDHREAFSFVFRFASTGKTAKIAELRVYRAPLPNVA